MTSVTASKAPSSSSAPLTLPQQFFTEWGVEELTKRPDDRILSLRFKTKEAFDRMLSALESRPKAFPKIDAKNVKSVKCTAIDKAIPPRKKIIPTGCDNSAEIRFTFDTSDSAYVFNSYKSPLYTTVRGGEAVVVKIPATENVPGFRHVRKICGQFKKILGSDFKVDMSDLDSYQCDYHGMWKYATLSTGGKNPEDNYVDVSFELKSVEYIDDFTTLNQGWLKATKDKDHSRVTLRIPHSGALQPKHPAWGHAHAIESLEGIKEILGWDFRTMTPESSDFMWELPKEELKG